MSLGAIAVGYPYTFRIYKRGVPASKKGVGSGQLDYWKLKKDLRVLISIN